MVHDHSPHAYQRSFLHMGTMNNGVVANADVVFQDGFALVVRAMDHGAILNVDALSHRDRCNVTTDHCRKPNRARGA